MKCPACDSSTVYHSRAKTRRDRMVKRLFPITFYRCHTCGWRRARFRKMSTKDVMRHTLSLAGYFGSIVVLLAIVGGVIFVTLTLLGIPMP